MIPSTEKSAALHWTLFQETETVIEVNDFVHHVTWVCSSRSDCSNINARNVNFTHKYLTWIEPKDNNA